MIECVWHALSLASLCFICLFALSCACVCVCRSIKCLACHRRCGRGDSRQRGRGISRGNCRQCGEGGRGDAATQLAARVSCYAGPNELPRFVSIIFLYCTLCPPSPPPSATGCALICCSLFLSSLSLSLSVCLSVCALVPCLCHD